MWGVEFFGILRCSQNDSKNLQPQIQMQRQGPWLGDGFIPTHRKLRDGWGTRRLVSGEEEQATAKARLRLGEDRGREADFSAARFTMGL